MDSLSLTGRRWHFAESPIEVAHALQQQHQLHPLVARCLSQSAGSQVSTEWLNPSWDQLHSPHLMHGLPEAVERIRRAIHQGESIRIVTDYDVDGTTSSLILQHTLRILKASGPLSYHIPHRFDEGYGFSVRAAQTAAEDGVTLIITADIGVRDHAAVNRAQELGVDVIVCDHHLPEGGSPPEQACAVLCPPQAACSYPNPALAACGVSLKLATALLHEHPKASAILSSMCKLAAIGTVADVVSLASLENRAIVALGLNGLNEQRHAPGLQALLNIAGLQMGHITASDIGFRIAPRINAAGRLDSATAVIELLNERDPIEAAQKATELDQVNQRRRSVQDRLIRQASAEMDENSCFGLVWGPEADGWHRGVVGIVAAKLRDQTHRPMAIASVQGEWARGSVRSTPELHAVKALESAAHLLERFGGHPAAAGFTVRTADLPALRTQLADYASHHQSSDTIAPELILSAEVSAASLNETLVAGVQHLGPFGKGNPSPLLSVTSVTPQWTRIMGKSHLKIGLGSIEAVWWNGARYEAELQGPIDLAGTIGFHHWRGQRQARLTIEDARPATPQDP